MHQNCFFFSYSSRQSIDRCLPGQRLWYNISVQCILFMCLAFAYKGGQWTVLIEHSLHTKYYILYLILRRFDLFSSWGMSNWFIYVPYGTNTRNPPRLSSHATQLKREILAGALFTSWTIWIPIRTTAPYPSPSRLSQGDVDMDNVLIIAPTWQFTRSW